MNTDFINCLLDVSRDISMHYFCKDNLHIETKADQSPVSIADKKAETAIRELIHQSYPAHGIIGEEFGADNADAEFVWSIDPIDGTRAFISGLDTFANMVCVLQNNIPIASGIGFPARGERYIAINGVTTLNGTQVQSQSYPISACQLSYTGLYMFTETQAKTLDKLRHVTAGESVGGDAYNYCRLAAGDNRIVCEADLQPYDFYPLIPILKNAGAYITDWQGQTLTRHSTGEVIASPSNHQQIIQVLQL